MYSVGDYKDPAAPGKGTRSGIPYGPRSRYLKEYLVTVDKPVTDAFLAGMACDVRTLDTKTKPCKVNCVGKYVFRISLTQGLNWQIHRMREVFGYDVKRLQRARIVNIKLGGLKVGRWRNLTEAELRGQQTNRTELVAREYRVQPPVADIRYVIGEQRE